MAFNINYYESNVDCKYCKKHYKTYKVRPMHCKVIAEDNDFMPVYEGLNPLLYEVAVCPHCGYAYHKSMTRTYGPFLMMIRELYINELKKPLNLCGERTLDEAIMSYKLAYLVAKSAMEEALLMGNLAIKIAWLYRLKEDKKNEMHYLRAAREFYSKAFATNKEGDERIRYLYAEISLQLGDIAEAKKSFSRLISGRDVSPKYQKRARNRWENYRYDEAPKNEVIS